MTSNLGSNVILDNIDQNGNIKEEAKEQIDRLLKQTFRPEFLNRLDDTVLFTPLTRENVYKIIDIMLKKLESRLEKQNLKLEVTQAAKDLIVDGGYDVTFGARPLKRYIESNVETKVAKAILQGNMDEGDTIVVDAKDGEIVVSSKH